LTIQRQAWPAYAILRNVGSNHRLHPKPDMVAMIKALALESDAAKKLAVESLEKAREKIETSLLLRTEVAETILSAFKPPK